MYIIYATKRLKYTVYFYKVKLSVPIKRPPLSNFH